MALAVTANTVVSQTEECMERGFDKDKQADRSDSLSDHQVMPATQNLATHLKIVGHTFWLNYIINNYFKNTFKKKKKTFTI